MMNDVPAANPQLPWLTFLLQPEPTRYRAHEKARVVPVRVIEPQNTEKYDVTPLRGIAKGALTGQEKGWYPPD
jgi:hypothetical protein